MDEFKDITVAEMILSDDWDIINILIGKEGYTRIKARRVNYKPGDVNIVQKYSRTDYVRKLYYQKFGEDMSRFGITI